MSSVIELDAIAVKWQLTSTILGNISVILCRRNNCNVNNELKWRNHNQIRQDKQNDDEEDDDDECEEACALADKGSSISGGRQRHYWRDTVRVKMNSKEGSLLGSVNGKSMEILSTSKNYQKKLYAYSRSWFINNLISGVWSIRAEHRFDMYFSMHFVNWLMEHQVI